MQYILLLIVLYLYIYNPVFSFVGFGFVNIMMALSLFYSITYWRKVKIYFNDYRDEFILSLLMLFYTTVICFLNGTEQIGMTLILWIISTVFVPILLIEVLICRQKGLLFFDTMVLVGFIASLFSCAALFSPTLNSFLRSIQVTREITDFAETQLAFRYFGLAINLSNAYGYVQGLLASLCLLRLDKNHKRYGFFFLTMTISVVINARTGLFPIGLTIIYIIGRSLSKLDLRNIIKFLFAGLVLLFLLRPLFIRGGETGEFILDFFNQIGSMFYSNDSGFEDSSYYQMFLVPETIQGIIFGEGRSLFNEGAFENSDIGYVNQLFLGGLIFVSLLLFYEFIVYYKIRYRSKEIVFSTIFFLSILIFNFKGVTFYSSSAFIKLWMLYYFVLVHNKRYPNNTIRL